MKANSKIENDITKFENYDNELKWHFLFGAKVAKIDTKSLSVNYFILKNEIHLKIDHNTMVITDTDLFWL